MAEDVIRCSKCGGTLSGETCANCGATGQAIRCEHCGALCPGDARWCPSCGRHLSAAAAKDGQGSTEETLSGGGNLSRLLLLFGLIVVSCVLIWYYAPRPAAAALAGVGLVFSLPAGRLCTRLTRSAPILVGGAIAASVLSFLTPMPVGAPSHRAPALVSGESDEALAAPDAVLARFTDNGADASRVQADLAVEWTREEAAAYVQQGRALPSQLSPVPHFQVSESINDDTHDVTIRLEGTTPIPNVTPAQVLLRALGTDPATVFVEPDYIYQALHTPDDPYYDEPYDSSRWGLTDQWYLRKIGGPEAWDHLRSVKSPIRLAIIDTGVDYKHPDLKDRMARDSKGKLIGRAFMPGKTDPLDDNGHGTHCAGIADAQTDNGTGVAGVGANSFEIVPAKVLLRAGYGEVGWIANAITWAADNGCRVESLSLGGGMYTQALQDSINYAWKKGVIVVAAAGNDGIAEPGYPAGNNHVVAVSATDSQDHLAVFSNYGMPIGVGAPGVNILATMPSYQVQLNRSPYNLKQDYDSLQGTSMACPVVSGTLAALLAYQPSLTPTQAIQRLEQSADNVAGTSEGGWDIHFGHGRVNLANAILNRARPASVGSFYGQICDSRGRAVAGARVQCGGVVSFTSQGGMFRFANLPVKSYDIEVKVNDRTASTQASIVPGADTNVTIVL